MYRAWADDDKEPTLRVDVLDYRNAVIAATEDRLFGGRR